MGRALILVVGFLIVAGVADCQNVLTGKQIYRANKEAVVEIGTGNFVSGDGFVVSSRGLIITANHVVTTRESGFKQYAKDIWVRIVRNGVQKIYPATPVEPSISDDQVNFDSVTLKIAASDLPHVTLGAWSEVQIGSEVTIIPSLPNLGPLMLQGTVSSKGPATNGLGPKPVDTVFFQCPVRNGFSGSPIFSQKGRVIGIVDTKVFGTSPALGQLRAKWLETGRTGQRMEVFGIDIAGSFIEVINNLDQNLISGLGSGVSIEYAKKHQEALKESTAQH